MWIKVIFCDAIVTAWECSADLRGSVWIADRDKGKEIPAGFTLAQIAEDGPYRIVKIAPK